MPNLSKNLFHKNMSGNTLATIPDEQTLQGKLLILIFHYLE